MIVDKLENADKYYALSKNIEKGLKFLQENNLKNFENGKYKIDGDDVYVSVQEYETKNPDTAKWEAHKKYTDIQYVIEGEEKIGFSNSCEMTICKEYDEENDIAFFDGEGNYLIAKEGDFIILMPQDYHKPSLNTTKQNHVKKAVVKVK